MSADLLAVLTEHGPATVAELAERTGRFRTTTYSELCGLERAGKVRRVAGRGREERFEVVAEEDRG